MLGGQIVTLLGHLLIVQVPRVSQLAELTGRYLTVLEQSLASAQPAERERIMTSVATGGPLRIERDRPPPESASNWLSRMFVAQMKTLLPGRIVIITTAPDEALWLEA